MRIATRRLATGAQAFIAGLMILLVAAAPARADSVAEFYQGRQINWILSAGEGGGYSSYARVFAPYLSAAMPGKPKIVIQNMPGAGGIRAMLYLNSTAPRDGSVIGLVHSGVPLAPVFGIKAAAYDARQFNWIGSLARSDAVCVAWHTAAIRTARDLFDKEFVVGGTGGGSQMETYPVMLNRLLGTKIRIVSGYKGGNDVYLAMERGEVQGRCGGGLNSINATRPAWIEEKKIVIPIVFAMKRSRDMPEVQTIMELARDERTKQVIEAVLAPQEMDRPLLAPPATPADRVAALRKAFHAAISEPAFLAEMKKQRLEVEEVSGEDVARIIARVYAMPPDVLASAREAIGMSE